jgi:ABC-type glutathione transport system ATPase component
MLIIHVPGAMERFADRAMLIHKSHLVEIGDPRKVLERYHQLS